MAHCLVALLARAWIEMSVAILSLFSMICRSPCESVDWNHGHALHSVANKSRSPCESVDWNYLLYQSWPSPGMSLSLRERGLKYKISGAQMHCGGVALLARAWIEMVIPLIWFNWVSRRSPCESVDWNFKRLRKKFGNGSRSPCESVDWNSSLNQSL